MKRLIVIVILSLTSLLLLGIEIGDELWLKAVKIKHESSNIYPSSTNYDLIIKDKDGNINHDIKVVLAHEEKNGEVANIFIEGFSNEKEMTAKDQPVPRYLETSVLMVKDGAFQSTISDNFRLTKLANEVIEDKEYAKYQVYMVSFHDKKELTSEGYAWIDAETGVPFQLSLDIDTNNMFVKSINATTSYSLSEEGYLISDKLVTDIIASLVFKKMYITQTITKKNFKKLGVK